MHDEADGGAKLGTVERGHRDAPFLTKRPKTRVRLGGEAKASLSLRASRATPPAIDRRAAETSLEARTMRERSPPVFPQLLGDVRPPFRAETRGKREWSLP